MEKVQKLKEVENESNPDLIQRLEVWLEDAKRGKLLAVAMVGDQVGGITRHTVEGPLHIPDAVYRLESLKFKLLRLMEDQEEDLLDDEDND